MSTKLTLTVDKEVIERAKKYAKSNGRSLSNIVEEYLKAIVPNSKKTEDIEISPLVDSLWGSVRVPDDFDYKEEVADYLVEKYMK